MKRLLFVSISSLCITNLFSQNFVEVQNIFPVVDAPQAQFIDFDNDNDLDIAVSGIFNDISQSYQTIMVYRNVGNDQFISMKVDYLISYFPSLGFLSVADINKDNTPEIVSKGIDDKMKFNQYTENSFIQLTGDDINDIPMISKGATTYGDFDNDGADEIIEDGNLYDIYKKRYNFCFDSVFNEWICPTYINKDSKPDIIRFSYNSYPKPSSGYFYINNGTGFNTKKISCTDIPSNPETGDYNQDGYEDLIIFTYKYSTNQTTAELYLNDQNGNFQFIKEIGIATSGRFLDIDNDGDLDLVLMGYYEVWNQHYLKFYENTGNGDFIALPDNTIQSNSTGSISVGDYDNDGDNDMLLTTNYPVFNILKLYKNMFVEENPGKENQVPSIPSNLKSEVVFNRSILSWNPSTDNESPSSSLTYNVYIRKNDGNYVTSPVADAVSGYRKIYRIGNTGFTTNYEISCLDDGKYYWSVQALDQSNRASEFAAIDSFVIAGTKPASPSELAVTTISDKKVRLNWKDNSDIEDGFSIEMYMQRNGSAGFYEYKTSPANINEFFIDSLTPDTKYIFRVKSFNCSSSSLPSNSDSTLTYPPVFTKKPINGYYGREAEWGDFDNDGDLDILTMNNEEDINGKYFIRIIENNIDSFTELVTSSIAEYSAMYRYATLNWLDYNNDGLLDIFVIRIGNLSAKMRIYRNNGDKTFTDIKCDSILDIEPGSCGPSFCDYDNDGDPDMVLAGNNLTTFEYETRLYENSGNGKFIDSGIRNIAGIIKSRMPWADFNNDGYVDILANKNKPDWTSNIVVYKNNGDKTFTETIFSNLPGLNRDYVNQSGDMRWGDYDNDGYVDILISGAHTGSNGSGITRIYKNNGNGTFIDSGIAGIYGMAMDVSVEWGDYNNDGILDILQTGDGWIDGVVGKTRIFYNDNNSFEPESDDSFLKVHQMGMSTAADYDRDGDLDILVMGNSNYFVPQVALFDNFQVVKNERPQIPANLSVEINNDEVVLKWDRSSDKETPSKGLSYNVFLFRDTDDTIIAPYALHNGTRTVVGTGNSFQNNFFKIKNLSSGAYHWSVQCIDNCFEASAFAEENYFNFTTASTQEGTSDISGILVFPNPVKDFIQIESSGADKDNYNIVVYDCSGKSLISINSTKMPCKIETSALSPGIYILSVSNGASVSNLKFMKKP